MATAPVPATAAAPIVAGEILLLPVTGIRMGERLRPVDEVWATALAGIIAREGQQTPIEVCRVPHTTGGWDLISGAHRLRAHQIAGIPDIEARERTFSPESRGLREASENLWRSDLDPIARAAHLAELVRFHKLRAGIDPDKDGRSIGANARWQKAIKAEAGDATATIAVAYDWSSELVEQLGLSERTVRDDLMLYRRLSAGVVARLRAEDHWIIDHAGQLKALAKLDHDDQMRVALRLTAGGAGEARTVAEALDQVAGKPKPVPDPEAKRLSAFIGAFSRMGIAEKKGALAQLAGMLPAGFRLVEGETPTAPGDTVLSDYEMERFVVAIRDALFYHGMAKPDGASAAMDNWRDAGDRIGIADAIAQRLLAALGGQA